MKVKINVKTPKNQASRCIETQKFQLLGSMQKNILETVLVAHNEYYWIIKYDDDKELLKVSKRCAQGEVLIKKFYRTLIKWIDRGNWLATKFKKGSAWVKRWIIRQAKKAYKNDPTFIKQIEDMKEDEISGFLVIEDREEMMALLDSELISFDFMEEENPSPAS